MLWDGKSILILFSSGLWFYGIKVVDKKLICLLSVAISLSKIEEEVSKIIESTFPNLFLWII